MDEKEKRTWLIGNEKSPNDSAQPTVSIQAHHVFISLPPSCHQVRVHKKTKPKSLYCMSKNFFPMSPCLIQELQDQPLASI